VNAVRPAAREKLIAESVRSSGEFALQAQDVSDDLGNRLEMFRYILIAERQSRTERTGRDMGFPRHAVHPTRLDIVT